jgi:hypothetical protein
MNKSNILANIVFVLTIVLISKITLFTIAQAKEANATQSKSKQYQLVSSDKLKVTDVDGNKGISQFVPVL